jgi:hypothetical protein
VSLPFDTKRVRAYEFEFGAGGNRLGREFLFDDGSLVAFQPEAVVALARGQRVSDAFDSTNVL